MNIYARVFENSLARIAALFFMLPLFSLLLCQYLNVYDRVQEPLAFIAVALLFFAAVAVVFFSLVSIFRKSAKLAADIILTAVDIIFLSLFIVVAFFPVQFSLIDGQELPPVPTVVTLKQTLIPLFIFCAIAFVRYKRKALFYSFHKGVQMLCLVSSVLMLASIQLDYRTQKNAISAQQATSAPRLGDRNIILLVVETLQGSYLEELAYEDPQLFASFTGMTLFSKATTSTPWSPFSVNQIFTGDNSWANYGSRQEAIDALVANSLISSGEKAGFVFSGGKYTPFPGYEGEGQKEMTYSLGVLLPRLILEHSKVYFATVRRVIPARLWRRLAHMEYTIYRKYLAAGQYPAKIRARDSFLDLTDKLSVGKGASFLYFFNYMTHLELLFSRDGVPIPGQESNKRNQIEEYRYTLSLYANFLDRLKALGKYDESMIIVTGDHGSYYEKNRMYNPALFIKLPSAQGTLRISDANVTLGDIRPLVEAFFQGDTTAELAFEKLREMKGPRKLSIYTLTSGRHDSGHNWSRHEIEGDLGSVISRLE